MNIKCVFFHHEIYGVKEVNTIKLYGLEMSKEQKSGFKKHELFDELS